MGTFFTSGSSLKLLALDSLEAGGRLVELRGKPPSLRDVFYSSIDALEEFLEEVRPGGIVDWRDEVLVAFLESEPVGSVYLNPKIKNLDWGVHVRRRFWRRGVGTALVFRAFEELGPGMEVIRVLGRGKTADERALAFYKATGAKLVKLWRKLTLD